MEGLEPPMFVYHITSMVQSPLCHIGIIMNSDHTASAICSITSRNIMEFLPITQIILLKMSMINLIDLFGCFLGKVHLRPPNISLVGQVGYAPALQDFQSCTSTKLVSVPLNCTKGGSRTHKILRPTVLSHRFGDGLSRQ